MTSAERLSVGTTAHSTDGADKESPRVASAQTVPTPAGPAASPPPKGVAWAGYIGALCAVGLIALGVVGIHDGIAAAGWISGGRWTQMALNWVDGQSFHGWMIPVAVAAVLLGLLCVYVALKPRRTRAVALTARTSVYLDLSDTARVAAAVARAVPGVTTASAHARRRKITVRAASTGADPVAQRAAIADTVADALAPLAKAPKVRVRTSIGRRR